MAVDIAPLFIPGAPGGPELLIILFIAILLFGANKIPQLARSTGEAMGEFQKGREKVESELEEMRDSGFDEATAEGETTVDAETTEATSTEATNEAQTEATDETQTETEEETN